MKRFAMLEDDDFFNTTNNPIELPRKATKNITAYAMVKPILNSVEIGSPRDDTAVVLVPKKENVRHIKYAFVID